VLRCVSLPCRSATAVGLADALTPGRARSSRCVLPAHGGRHGRASHPDLQPHAADAGVQDAHEPVEVADEDGASRSLALSVRLLLLHLVADCRSSRPVVQIACFPDATGYAIGTIEGRVAIQCVVVLAARALSRSSKGSLAHSLFPASRTGTSTTRLRAPTSRSRCVSPHLAPADLARPPWLTLSRSHARSATARTIRRRPSRRACTPSTTSSSTRTAPSRRPAATARSTSGTRRARRGSRVRLLLSLSVLRMSASRRAVLAL